MATHPSPTLAIELPREAIEEFCRRGKITELAVFGSALRDDFGPESDLDFLVTFAPEATWSLFDKVGMWQELEMLLGRRLDLVSRRGVERSRNPIRSQEILAPAEVFVAER